MNELLSYYTEILEKIESSNLKVRNEENKKLACYFFNKGDLYDNKLMVIGRAGNGGSEANAWKQGDSAFKNMGEYIQTRYMDSMTWKLSWVTEQWGKNDGMYNTAVSRFWQLIREVQRGITEQSKWDEKKWSQKIVWSNIYKFSPMNGGNPNFTLQMLQLDECKKILRWEIENFKPRNILFVTGNWFDDVNDLFERNNDQWIYKYNDKEYANLYISERPEHHSPYKMAQDIISKMNFNEI